MAMATISEAKEWARADARSFGLTRRLPMDMKAADAYVSTRVVLDGLSASRVRELARAYRRAYLVEVRKLQRNPRKPSTRVGKALKKYVQGQLPRQWTPAEVRVNEKGQVQVKVNPAKIKGGVRNARNVRAVVGGGPNSCNR